MPRKFNKMAFETTEEEADVRAIDGGPARPGTASGVSE
jgi:hypothetical protein